jgi:hypothetical protein
LEQLKFTMPRFNKGLNVTCRLGTKWADNFHTNSPAGDPLQVELATEDGEKIGIGVIEAVHVDQFYTVPSTVLELEHDMECRSLDRLYDTMKYCYGDNFHAGSEVTFVFFRVTKVNDDGMWNDI